MDNFIQEQQQQNNPRDLLGILLNYRDGEDNCVT